MDLGVIRIEPSNGRVHFTNTEIDGRYSPLKLNGPLKLCQKCILMVLRGFYTDAFDPPTGGNYLSFIGINLDPSNVQYITNKLVANVKKVEQEILTSQQEADNIFDDEKLKSLNVINVRPILSEGRIEVDIRVTPVIGGTIPIILPLGYTL